MCISHQKLLSHSTGYFATASTEVLRSMDKSLNTIASSQCIHAPPKNEQMRSTHPNQIQHVSVVARTLLEKSSLNENTYHRPFPLSGSIRLKLRNTSCIGRSRVPISSLSFLSRSSSLTALNASILSATRPAVSWYCSSLCTPSAN